MRACLIVPVEGIRDSVSIPGGETPYRRTADHKRQNTLRLRYRSQCMHSWSCVRADCLERAAAGRRRQDSTSAAQPTGLVGKLSALFMAAIKYFLVIPRLIVATMTRRCRLRIIHVEYLAADQHSYRIFRALQVLLREIYGQFFVLFMDTLIQKPFLFVLNKVWCCPLRDRVSCHTRANKSHKCLRAMTRVEAHLTPIHNTRDGCEHMSHPSTSTHPQAHLIPIHNTSHAHPQVQIDDHKKLTDLIGKVCSKPCASVCVHATSAALIPRLSLCLSVCLRACVPVMSGCLSLVGLVCRSLSTLVWQCAVDSFKHSSVNVCVCVCV